MLCLCRTGDVASRLAGWRLLFRYRDGLSVVGDGLATLSAETIRLKLRGSCMRQNVRDCLITFAAFPIPTKAALGLLRLMMVLVVILGWVLARWRSGAVAHLANIASL